MMTTMLEVAKRAGVSKATVSRVLSGNGYVSQETKDRVFQAVEESGYRPNLLARNLSAKSTQTLGLVVTNTLYHGIYFSELLFHAARMAEEKGRQLLLADGKHSAEEERQAIQYLLDLRCDAIMIYPRFLSVDEIDDIIDAHSQPIMVLNRRLRKNSSHSVWCDHKQTSFNAVAELINAGHQEIAFLTGSMDSPTSIERLAGYKDALAQHGIALNEKLIANGKWTPPCGSSKGLLNAIFNSCHGKVVARGRLAPASSHRANKAHHVRRQPDARKWILLWGVIAHTAPDWPA